jgi:hypothetical protein
MHAPTTTPVLHRRTPPVYHRRLPQGNGLNGLNGHYDADAGPPPTPIGVITGQSIAKRKKWSKREQAHSAALWRLSHINVVPTTKLAAEVFGVSVPLVNDVLGILRGHAPKPKASRSNGNGHDKKMSQAEVDAFVLEHQNEVWAAFVRITG